MQHNGLRLFFTVCLFTAVHSLFAEIISSKNYQFAIDLPEGFVLSDTDGNGTAYEFTHSVLPIQTAVRLYESSRYASAYSALSDSLHKLSGRGELSNFNWRNTQSSIAQFTMEPFPSQRQYGWGLAIPIPAVNSILVILAYTPENIGDSLDPILLSILDSVYTDRGSYFTAGPVTSFAFPATKSQSVDLCIYDNTVIQTQIQKDDAEANKFVIEREFSILQTFFTIKELSPYLMESYKRYYRLIFRDGYDRLKQASFDIYNHLNETLNTDGITIEKEREQQILTILLDWVQNMQYGRDLSGSDFTPLPLVLQGQKSDCDGRVMLLAVLLTHMNFKTALFVSPEKGHAILGVACDLPGFKFSVDGIEYLMCETIENVTPGLIPQNMSDPNVWLVVPF